MKIAVISKAHTDIENILASYGDITHIDPSQKAELSSFDACAILGGTEDQPLFIPIDLRLNIEAFRESGKPVFAEWCHSIGYTYIDDVSMCSTVSDRMIYVGGAAAPLSRGDLLDDRANSFIRYYGSPADSKPLLCFAGHVIAHDRIAEIPDYEQIDYTLWISEPSTMICAFRISNYVRARFAPHERWDAVVSLIVSHLVGRPVSVRTEPKLSMDNPATTPAECFSRGLTWFEGANILIDNGAGGVTEGLSHKIFPDGTQAYNRSVRNDCSGEVGGAYFFDYYLNKNQSSYERFKNLQHFCFEKLYESRGENRGMLRWSTTAWGVCYQDDFARTMLGSLLAMKLTDDREYLDRICASLDYLLSSTCADGLRISRTDAQFMTPEKNEKLRGRNSNFPCAHHNGYYMAVLALAYSITGEKKYLDAATKGIETLMAAFPNTVREHSETQELCRLILPLACIYDVTHEEKHREYLYTVLQRLEEHRDERGGYLEYDTGYQAARSRTSGTESSLLADNGDPVQDLLYSVNWLPLAFAYAYKATGDEKFLSLWRDIVRFLSEIQAVSGDKTLSGAWCRAIDCARREAYGMPHDVGWGPCAIESGWTVAEILMGIGFGMALGMDDN